MVYASYAVVAIVLMLVGYSVASRFIDNHGLVSGKLRACGDKPNCVCSEDYDNRNYPSLELGTTTPDVAWQQFKKAIVATGGDIKQDDGNYLWATYTTRLLRFVDDVEARLDKQNMRIHIRSASRVGSSDLGANRQRVDRIVKLYRANEN